VETRNSEDKEGRKILTQNKMTISSCCQDIITTSKGETNDFFLVHKGILCILI